MAFACLLYSSSRPNDVPGIYTKNLEKFLLVLFLLWPVYSVCLRAEYLMVMMARRSATWGIRLCIFDCLFSSVRPCVADQRKA